MDRDRAAGRLASAGSPVYAEQTGDGAAKRRGARPVVAPSLVVWGGPRRKTWARGARAGEFGAVQVRPTPHAGGRGRLRGVSPRGFNPFGEIRYSDAARE